MKRAVLLAMVVVVVGAVIVLRFATPTPVAQAGDAQPIEAAPAATVAPDATPEASALATGAPVDLNMFHPLDVSELPVSQGAAVEESKDVTCPGSDPCGP